MHPMKAISIGLSEPGASLSRSFSRLPAQVPRSRDQAGGEDRLATVTISGSSPAKSNPTAVVV